MKVNIGTEKYINRFGIEIGKLSSSDKFFVLENSSTYINYYYDILSKIEEEIILLSKNISRIIFTSLEEYYKIEPSYSLFLVKGGLNSELSISKDDFEFFINILKDKMNNHEMIHKGLYFYDLENLINILHSAVISINDYIIHFYIQLNKIKVSSHSLKRDGIYIIYGIENSIVISLLQSSFTSIFTVLDILTKIAFEIENLPNSWQDYPRYSSSNILYTSYKKLRNKYSDESIFTNNYYIKLTETMRNEFIHNHNLESIPKFYCEVKNFTVVQKFILFPDIDKYGNLVKSKNRKRFFSQEKKINLELPEFIEVIYRKVHITLKEMNHKIKE